MTQHAPGTGERSDGSAALAADAWPSAATGARAGTAPAAREPTSPGPDATAPLPRSRDIALQSAVVAVAATVLWFLLFGRLDFDLSDEGYLWYGAQRILHGEWPIRDFQAYDPGRYFIVAAFFGAFGDSTILTLRLAGHAVICAAVGLTVFTVLHGLRHETRRQPALPWLLAPATALLTMLWIYPYYKGFDRLAAALLVLAVYGLLLRRNRTAWFLTGVCVGFATLVGRNHGLYGGVASVLAFLLLAFTARTGDGRPGAKEVVAWIAGVAAGYAPMLVAFVAVDGLWRAFVDGILEMARLGKTNLPLQVYWPWWARQYWREPLTLVLRAAPGVGFVALLAFPLAALAVVLRRREVQPRHAAFVAAACVALPYAHYAFSRADVVHLALSMHPLVVGLLTAPFVGGAFGRIALAGLALVFSGFVLADAPVVARWSDRSARWESIEVQGEKLVVLEGVAADYRERTVALRRHDPAGKSFFAMPNLPGLHAIHDSRIATHEIYIGFPLSAKAEEAEIDRLAGAAPRLILVSNHALDHDEALRFRNLRPRMYRWIVRHYRRLPDEGPLRKDALEVYLKP